MDYLEDLAAERPALATFNVFSTQQTDFKHAGLPKNVASCRGTPEGR